jgi:DNA-binding GntR family transcriptional regulator
MSEEQAARPFVQRLREDLLAGRFRSGQWLKQVDLQADYGVNRFEVRIALSDLAVRHLLDHFPNRGYRVANPDEQEREDLYELRTMMETAASKIVVLRVTPSDIQEFAVLVQAFNDAIDGEHVDNLSRINYELHDRFYQITGNALLVRQIRELRERGVPGRVSSWRTVAGIKASNSDHLEMLDMLKQRDGEGLAHIVYRHLNRWREFSKASFE